MKNLRKGDEPLFRFVNAMMIKAATQFRLPLRRVLPLEKENCSRYFGRCEKDGTIYVRVRDASKGGRRWKGIDEPYQIIDTMSHELAHLITLDHTPKWFDLHLMILGDLAGRRVFEVLSNFHEQRRRH